MQVQVLLAQQQAVAQTLLLVQLVVGDVDVKWMRGQVNK